MTTDLMTAYRAVRDDFMPAEATTDLAAAQTARLLATVLERRAATGVPIGTGALMIRKLGRSFAAQLDAREEFIAAHKLAVALPAELGINPTQFGDTEPCPDATGHVGAQVPLSDASPDNIVRFAAR